MRTESRLCFGVVMLCAAIVSGCATRAFRAEVSPPDGEPLTAYQTQVSIGECVFKPAPESAALAAIAASLVASTITQGVNYLGKAIEESAKETNDRVTATRNVEVTAKTFGPCVQIIRGWFRRGFQNKDASVKYFNAALEGWAKSAAGSAIDEARLTLLWQQRMWLAAQPDFIFEAQVVTSSDPKSDSGALAFVPVYARLDHPISTPLLRHSKERGVAVFLAFHEVGGDPAAPNAGAGGMVLGVLQPGVDRPFPPHTPNTERTPNRDPNESKWFKIAIGDNKKPMTVTALVTEHQDAQPFLQFIADVFAGAKTPIAESLQKAAVPALRDKAEETAKAAGETALTDYEDALSNALAAAKSCAGGVADPIKVASDARSKVRKLNKAARAAGKREQNETTVPLSMDSKAVQDGCIRLRDVLISAVSS